MKPKQTRNAFWAFVIGFVAAYAVIILGNVFGTMAYLPAVGDRQKAILAASSNQILQTALYIGMELTLFLVIYFFIRKVEKKPFSFADVGLWRQPGRGRYIWLGILLVIITKLVVWGLLMAFGVMRWKTLGFMTFSPLEVVGYFLLMLVNDAFPGVFEEMFFRGYVQNRLLQSHGAVFSVLVTSVLFALIHIGIYKTPLELTYVLLLGVLLGTLAIRTQSLYFPIGIHFAWDFTNSWISNGEKPSLFVFQLFGSTGETVIVLMYIAAVLVLFAGTFVWKGQRRIAIAPSKQTHA